MPSGMRDPNSLPGDQTCTSYIGSSESEPLHCQGSPLTNFLMLDYLDVFTFTLVNL